MMHKDFRNDISGGVEGLPLQLMIIIVVATMSLAIMVGWLGNVETPQSIGEVSVENDGLDGSSGTVEGLTVTVRDQDGEYLEGAVVVLQGMNVHYETEGVETTASETTDAHGRAAFDTLHIDPTGTGSVGFITVTVSLAGYGEDSGTMVTVIL